MTTATAATKDAPATVANGLVSEHLSTSRDRARGKPMAVIRVHNAMVSNLTIGNAGCTIPMGWAEALVYEDDIPVIQREMVEDDLPAWAAAQDSYLTRLAEDLLAEVGGWSTKPASEMVAAIKLGKDARVMEAFSKLSAITSQSPEGEFRRAKGRDVRPLRSLEVVSKGLPEPQQVSSDDALRRSLSVVAGALSPQLLTALANAIGAPQGGQGGGNRR